MILDTDDHLVSPLFQRRKLCRRINRNAPDLRIPLVRIIVYESGDLTVPSKLRQKSPSELSRPEQIEPAVLRSLKNIPEDPVVLLCRIIHALAVGMNRTRILPHRPVIRPQSPVISQFV